MSARPLRFLGIAVFLMSAPIARAEVTRELHGQLAVAAGREFAVENLLGTMQVVAGPGPDVVVTATVYAALQLMAEKGIGALLVIEHGAIQGIVSERDYARKVILMQRTSRETLVRDIMTNAVIYVYAGVSGEISGDQVVFELNSENLVDTRKAH